MIKKGLGTADWLGIYLMVPMVLVFIPTAFLESAQSVCLFKNILGASCPGCGMTRAISSTLHGDFSGAFGYNRLVVIVFPLLVYLWIRGVLATLVQASHEWLI